MSILTSFVEKALRTTVFEYSPSIATTCRPGVAYPVLNTTVLPGDSFGFKPYIRVDSLPLQAPLLGSMSSRLAFFYLPWRALVPRMKLDIAGLNTDEVMLPQYLHPFFTAGSSATVDSGQYLGQEATFSAPNSLASYLYNISRYAGLYTSDFKSPEGGSAYAWALKNWSFEGFSYIMYYSVMYYYYLNRQHSRFAMFNTEIYEAQSVDGGSLIYPTTHADQVARRGALLTSVALSDLEDALMAWSMGNFRYTKSAGPSSAMQEIGAVNAGWYIPEYSFDPTPDIGVVAPMVSTYTSEPYRMSRDLSGLVATTLDPDMANVYVNTPNGLAQQKFSVSVVDNKVFIDDILQVNALRKFTALGAFSAAGYRDWVYAQTGLTIPADETRPVYLGSMKLQVNFNAVLATSSDGLGDLGGRSSQGDAGKFRRYNFEDFGTFMAIFSIRPHLAYSDNLDLTHRMRTLTDVVVPVKQNMPWQPIHLSQLSQGNCDMLMGWHVDAVTEEMETPIPWSISAADGTAPATYEFQYAPNSMDPSTFTVGFQPAYTEYMSTLSRIKGNLQRELDYWALSRPVRSTSLRPSYPYMASDVSVPDSVYNFSPYATPQDTQLAWVDNSTSAENFIVQIVLKGSMRRIFTKHAIPSL